MTQFSAAKLAQIALRFRALGEPTRIRIVEALSQGEQPVSQVVKTLHVDQSNVSKHLQVLYHAGLVKRQRSANTVLYSLADPALLELCRAMGALPQRRLRLRRSGTDRSRAHAADRGRRRARGGAEE
jgi:DNA-binding transcriptional ArsR family regulator